MSTMEYRAWQTMDGACPHNDQCAADEPCICKGAVAEKVAFARSEIVRVLMEIAWLIDLQLCEVFPGEVRDELVRQRDNLRTLATQYEENGR
jgi:hypothetical protein